MYAVLVFRSDCGDSTVFMVEDEYGRDHWATFDEARSTMKADYGVMLDEYPVHWMNAVSRKRCRYVLRKASASFAVPIWDAGRKRASSLKCRWKVVKI